MRVHFIGIGGIGVSALAKYHLEKGHLVSGSDLASSEITEGLRKRGAKIYIGEHKAENLSDNTDTVVYSPAVKKDNPEMKKAKKMKIKVLSYPQVIGILSKKHFTIAVSGTHGKSTTTSMIGLILIKAGFDPTIIVGTKLKELGDSNCRVGKSKYLIIEADEHFASFLNYWPKIIILTSVEADHLDYYKNLKNVINAFKKYVKHLSKDGILIVNGDDKNISNIKKVFKSTVKNYSLKQADAGKLKKILKVPGEHNISNALAALELARSLGISDKISFKALSEYKGSWRRFETVKVSPFTLINDYAHHPTEVAMTLKAVREKYLKKKIWCIYQPHQYQRTYYLFNSFVTAFQKAPVDRIIITDIYDVAGRENIELKQKVSSEKLVKKINRNNVIYLPNEELSGYLTKNIKKGQALIVMGAGDIYNLAVNLTETKKKKKIY